ncbi:MAG: neutral/alkaline non-lysosomal ceramidase N-terminal domain-containing protein [Promethearchaeota archaeon]
MVFKAGFQEVVITSPIGTTALAGYGGLKKFAQGINDQLMASCVVIDDGVKTIAIVSLDLVGMLPDTVDKIRRLATDLTSGAIKESDILLACTHTHSGPDTMGIFAPGHFLQYKPDAVYMDLLVRFVAGAILGAFNRLGEVEIKVGKDLLFNASSNRRLELPPNPKHERTIDPEVQALFFERDGKVIGTIVNFAAHGTAFPTSTTMHISADFVGALRTQIKKKFGLENVCVYLNGAIGDVSPRSTPLTQDTPQLEIIVNLGEKSAAIKNFVPFCKKLKMNPREFPAFYDKIATNPRLPFHEKKCEISIDKEGKLTLAYVDGVPKPKAFRKIIAWYLFRGMKEPPHVRVGKMIASKVGAIHRKRKPLDPERTGTIAIENKKVRIDVDDPEMANEGLFEDLMIKDGEKIYSDVEIQVIKLAGKVYILTIPGEVITQVQLRLKQLIRNDVDAPIVMISGVTNGEIGYILTPEEFDLAGYESMICFGRENAYILEKGLMDLVSSIEGRLIEWDVDTELPAYDKARMPQLKEIIDIKVIK